jgi:hypothetical protein
VDLVQIMQAQLQSSAMSTIGVYKDFSALLDLEELVNNTTLKSEKSIEKIQEAAHIVRSNAGIIK